MASQNYSILGISETWLDSTFDESKLYIEGYQKPFRRDNTSHSCGSMLYIANNTPATRKELYEPSGSEIICVEMNIKKIKILISSCYTAVSELHLYHPTLPSLSNGLRSVVVIALDLRHKHVLFSYRNS